MVGCWGLVVGRGMGGVSVGFPYYGFAEQTKRPGSPKKQPNKSSGWFTVTCSLQTNELLGSSEREGYPKPE